MATITEKPKPGEKWHLRSDPYKVLTVKWCNDCDYVQFHAPWMKVCQTLSGLPSESYSAGSSLETFLRRYTRVER